MALKDLRILETQLKESFQLNFNPLDRVLTDSFKEGFRAAKSECEITFFECAVRLTFSSSLSIYLPNQTFFIAAYFIDLYNALNEYRELLFSLFPNKEGKEKIKQCQGNRQFAESLLDSVNYQNNDREFLIKFLSDYNWWKGGKTIDRGDYCLSPLLSCMGLVVQSQTYVAELCKDLAENPLLVQELHKSSTISEFHDKIPQINAKEISDDYVTHKLVIAMRTKPFLLLAGISGTGKSRIVKQMAFDSCPDNAVLRSDLTSPGNYCLIEVKPNWHDSTELLGFESKIGGDHYQLTPFVKFLAKAMLYPDVPFFVCLDEMNLAPVEQYFAEFLSVLESRTKLSDGHIVSEPLIKAEIFANKDYELKLQDDLFGLEIKEETTADGKQRLISGKLSEEAQSVYNTLKKQGLRIPENVIVIGTVNMDETTHQFSRKVIDRAMTIEMNLPEGDPFMDFFANGSELAYSENPTSPSLYLATETKASSVAKALAEDNAEKTEWLKGEVAAFLTNLNGALDGTPFKVAYRVQNELMLYFYQLWLEDKTADWEKILQTSCDQILMMKVLPRIEGDGELLETPLKELALFCEQYTNASKKIAEMRLRLERSQFTSFWP